MATGSRKARNDDSDERPMVTLVDPNGQEFSTGHLPTLNRLMTEGYSVKDGTPAEAVETLTPAGPRDQGATTTG